MHREKRKNLQFLISLIGAVVLALLALVIAVTVVSTLKLNDANVVLGPGFYPFSLSILMFLSCLCVIYYLLYRDSEDVVTKSVFNSDTINKPLTLLTLAIAAVAAIPLLGFLVSMFLFSFVELTYLEKHKQPVVWRIVYSVAIVGGLYWLFTGIMKSSLPIPFWL